jgi:hypothetical protein
MNAALIYYGIIFPIFFVFIIKVLLAGYYHSRVITAITDYTINLILQEKDHEIGVTFDDMEDLYATLWRLWDWGYKHILPKEKFEIIKPYLKKEKKK